MRGETFPILISLQTITLTSLKPNSQHVIRIRAIYIDGFVITTQFEKNTTASGNNVEGCLTVRITYINDNNI